MKQSHCQRQSPQEITTTHLALSGLFGKGGSVREFSGLRVQIFRENRWENGWESVKKNIEREKGSEGKSL